MYKLLKKFSYIPLYFRLYSQTVKIIGISIIARATTKRTGGWLILERGNDAQDNAWHFFKYMIKEHPEIEVRYAIRKSSPDYSNNLKGYEKYILEYNSFEYYRYLFNSDVIISTHLKTYLPEVAISSKLEKTPFKYRGKIVFLQHGVTHQEHKGLIYPKQKIDLFISGAKNEYDLLESDFGYPNGVIKYTGFARYDNLIDFNPKKEILIMPTWRGEYVGYNDTQFEDSDFYQNYSALLSNPELLAILKESGYNICFYNHYEFQRFNHLFERFTGPNLKILKFGERRVQDLLKDASVLVTDYSSIYYDVLYMNKPIIFFQFDKEYFDTHHYGKNYDNVSEFGFTTRRPHEAIDCIISLINNGCQLPPAIKQKSNEIFQYRDKSNCKRIFEAIVNLQQK